MFTQQFCDRLEYFITKVLAKSDEIEKRRCWCDGVLLPEKTYPITQLKKVKQIVTRAWIDEGREKGKQNGQFIYDLTLHFGEKALAEYKTVTGLEDCLPEQIGDDWFYFDVHEKKIEIQLL